MNDNQDKPGRQLSVMGQIQEDFTKREQLLAAALPAHMPPERFIRVVMTAVQNDTKLQRCTRTSLFNAAMKAAQDGLLPDKREGAIVSYKDQAQWMPMVLGLRKKARNSGVLADWQAHVVHEGDEFDYQLGDEPFIYHKPQLFGGRDRPVVAAYSVATFKDGTKSREVMTIDEIEDVRKRYARSKDGPWSDPIAYPEMCRKTVARLHAKSLPMSSDLDDLVRRDDELYDFKKEEGQIEPGKGPRRSIKAFLDEFSSGDLSPQQSDAAAEEPASPPSGPQDHGEAGTHD